MVIKKMQAEGIYWPSQSGELWWPESEAIPVSAGHIQNAAITSLQTYIL